MLSHALFWLTVGVGVEGGLYEELDLTDRVTVWPQIYVYKQWQMDARRYKVVLFALKAWNDVGGDADLKFQVFPLRTDWTISFCVCVGWLKQVKVVILFKTSYM